MLEQIFGHMEVMVIDVFYVAVSALLEASRKVNFKEFLRQGLHLEGIILSFPPCGI